ncbi:PTS glucitol/sorbitol transporter subunit IIC [[Clostridium] innocuum]|nr:PTS glucitol/sorbitol transporter subunit IIC [[Clostridium] innocuum]
MFVYMGIASGITQQKLSLSALATRYFCLCVIKKQ